MDDGAYRELKSELEGLREDISSVDGNIDSVKEKIDNLEFKIAVMTHNAQYRIFWAAVCVSAFIFFLFAIKNGWFASIFWFIIGLLYLAYHFITGGG